MPEAGVLAALRAATRGQHVQLAALPAMARLFDAAYTTSEYRAHLGRLLGLFEPLELAVEAACNPENVVRTLQRSKALRDDLRSLGSTPSEIDGLERCRALPAITSAGFRGCTYVMLGSMLGGRVIAARLRSVLGAHVSLYFYGDGEARLEERWASFQSDLERHGKPDVSAICSTAAALFEAYAAWFAASPGART